MTEEVYKDRSGYEILQYINYLESKLGNKNKEESYELSIEDMGTVEKLNYGNYIDIAEHIMKTDPKLAMLLSDALSARITLEAMVTNPKGYLNSKEGE